MRYHYATTGFPLEYPDRLEAVRRLLWARMRWRDKLRFVFGGSRERQHWRARQRAKRLS